MRQINQCLNSKLIDICNQAMKLDALNDIVSAYLPEAIKKHCQVGSFNKGCLQLIVNDSIWASQLRYVLPEIRDKLRSEARIYQLTNIKIKILSETLSLKRPARRLHISSTAREHILEGANNMPDGALKNALLKLGTA